MTAQTTKAIQISTLAFGGVLLHPACASLWKRTQVKREVQVSPLTICWECGKTFAAHGRYPDMAPDDLCALLRDINDTQMRELRLPLCRSSRCRALGIRADPDSEWCRECEEERRQDAAEARAESIREARMMGEE